MKKRNEHILELAFRFVLLMLLMAVVGYGLIIFENTFDSPEQMAAYIQSLGAIGPIIAILIISIEVIIAPIPGALIAIATGYAFGGFFGSIYTYIGNIIGTIAAFLLARKFGKPLVSKFISKKKINYYTCFFEESGNIFLWFIYLFPILPADIVSFVAGLTNIKFTKFLRIILIAYIPYVILFTNFGEKLFSQNLNAVLTYGIGILITGLIITILYFRMKKKVKKSCKI